MEWRAMWRFRGPRRVGTCHRNLKAARDWSCERISSAVSVGETFVDWTKEKIEALSPEGREALFDNARAKGGPEAQRIIDLMVEHDLLVRAGGGLPRDHPTIQEIEEIIRSD